VHEVALGRSVHSIPRSPVLVAVQAHSQSGAELKSIVSTTLPVFAGGVLAALHARASIQLDG
jgi:hypothetical protein